MKDIESKTLNELRKYCRDNKIKGYSSKKKLQLIELINNFNKKENVIVENIIIGKDENKDENKDVNKDENKDENKDKNKDKNKNENKDNKDDDDDKKNDEETSDDYLSENITLYWGDCIKRMEEILDDSIELILCDLPYGTTKCKWDTIIDIDKLWEHYKRIIKKPSGVILLFGQQPFTSKLISSNYDWYKYNLIWKKNKTTQYLLANYRPMKCTEDICVFSKGGAAAASRKKGNMTYNPQGLIPVNIKKKNSEKRIGKMLNQTHHLGPNNKLTSNTEYSQKFTNYPNELIEFDIEYDTIHETQKPVKLIEYLIETYSNKYDTVLDNAMGSGTTGIGCISTNRKFIGIELEEKYFKLAKNRIIKKL
tara:strand:- start:910 stop:2007 length:1098 start_codon:yes stop_codon:yes gene_type:complete